MQEVLAMIEEVTGNKVPRRVVARRPGDPPALVADPRKAQELLQWKASRSLRDIIATAWKLDAEPDEDRNECGSGRAVEGRKYRE